MRTIYYLLIISLFFGCKSKSLTVEKSFEKEKENWSRYYDSLISQSIKMQLDWQKQQTDISKNLILKSSNEFDSLGNRIPFHYKHFVDGQLKEEIFLQGGDIVNETISNESSEYETKTESKTEKTLIEVDVGQEKIKQKKSIDKAKKVEVKGFQFGFYIWLLLIIILLLLLRWLSKRFKLFDKFKSVLKGEKKPSDI